MATTLFESRSYSSLDYKPPNYEMGVVNTDTRLGTNVLSRKFVKELEHYYDRADIRDKAKCLELITSVRLGDELKKQVKMTQRPKTAMPSFGYRCAPASLNPYSTTYAREYVPKVEDDANAIRPMTSDGYATQVPDSQPMGPTTYDVEYARKFQRPASPERIGTASGNRNNKPHPPKEFMVWKFPQRTAGQDIEKVSPELTNQKLNQITKRLCHSVYQNDYLGIPQGFQMKSAYNLPPDWKDNVGYGMDSNQRESYQQPFQQRELGNPTTRYGANLKKALPAKAVMPTANKRMFGVNTRTTYDRHFNDNAVPCEEQIRDVGRKLGALALKNHYSKSCGDDRDLIGKLMEEYGTQPYSPPKPPCYERPGCPSPMRAPAGSRCSPHHAPKTPVLRFSHSSLGKSARKQDSPKSRSSSPAYKPRPMVPAATVITLPHNLPYETTMPTSPISAPYSPPLYLS